MEKISSDGSFLWKFYFNVFIKSQKIMHLDTTMNENFKKLHFVQSFWLIWLLSYLIDMFFQNKWKT